MGIQEKQATVEKSKSSRKGNEAGGVVGWGRVLTIHEQVGDTRLGRGYPHLGWWQRMSDTCGVERDPSLCFSRIKEFLQPHRNPRKLGRREGRGFWGRGSAGQAA